MREEITQDELDQAIVKVTFAAVIIAAASFFGFTWFVKRTVNKQLRRG